METLKTFDFSKVILGSQIDLALIGQAAIDGFLAPGVAEELTDAGRKIRNKQKALALLILFNQIILPDAVGGDYEIPILEREGILQIHRGQKLLLKDFDRSDWQRHRDPEVFVRVLSRTIRIRPLVLEYVARRRLEFVEKGALLLGLTHKEFINSIIDLAYFHYLGDKSRLKTNPFVQALPASFIKEIRKDLKGQPPSDNINPVDQILFGAAHAGSLLDYYSRLSQSFGVGVATNEFSGRGRLWNKYPEIQRQIENVAESFCLVRAALHEESHFFPKIEGIRHALKLRNDPNLKAFRAQLALFQNGLIQGDSSDLFRLAKEVYRSAGILRKNTLVRRGLDWLTLASLPASVVETLVQGLPIASLSLSIFSIAGTLYSNRVENLHRWVLFGR